MTMENQPGMLLIESDPDIRYLLETFFLGRGYDVHGVADESDAKALFEIKGAERIQIILSEIKDIGTDRESARSKAE